MSIIVVVLSFIAIINAQVTIDCEDLDLSSFLDFASFLDSLDNKANITSLICNDAGFSGLIPPEISELTNLEELSLADNSFEGELPATLQDISSLTVLNLDRNCLTGSIFEVTNELDELEVLQIEKNKFDGNLDDFPATLTVFLAALNDFSGSFPDNLDGNEDLTTFDVSGNRLSGDIPDILADLPLIDFFIGNNDFSGIVPEHQANNTDAEVGTSPDQSNLIDRFEKYFLDPKCPNLVAHGAEKAFTVSLVYSIIILVVCCVCSWLPLVGCWCCYYYFCVSKDKKGNMTKSERLKSVVSMNKSTVYGASDHYKIDTYLCQSSVLNEREEELIKAFRSKLKKNRINPTIYRTDENEKTIDNNGMLDSAAVIILFSQKYLNEMLNSDSRAFAEVRGADGAGQWIIFACLDRKLFIRGNTQKFLECDYHMFDISSPEALEKNLEDILVNLYQAQAEKEVLLNDHF